MMTLLFMVLFFFIFGKIAVVAFKAAWGITKILMYIIFLPIILIGMFFSGLIYLALILLIICGLVSFFSSRV